MSHASLVRSQPGGGRNTVSWYNINPIGSVDMETIKLINLWQAAAVDPCVTYISERGYHVKARISRSRENLGETNRVLSYQVKG